MLTRLVGTIAVAVFVIVGLPSHANGFEEMIPTKIGGLKWGGTPPVGKLFKLVSKGRFTLPSEGNGPDVLGASLTVDAGELGTLSCDLTQADWMGLGSPAGTKGWKYRNTAASGNNPCKSVIIKERVIKAVAKGTGSIASPSDDSYPNVTISLTAGEANYCALAEAPHSKVRAAKFIKMNDQPAPEYCSGTTTTSTTSTSTTSTTLLPCVGDCPAGQSCICAEVLGECVCVPDECPEGDPCVCSSGTSCTVDVDCPPDEFCATRQFPLEVCVTSLSSNCSHIDDCQPGQACGSPSLLACGTAPVCGAGNCPPGTICSDIEFPYLPICFCLSEDQTCYYSDPPTCGGGCPTGQVCGQATGDGLCTCVPDDSTCLISQAPTCGGSCPAGEVCGESTSGGVCICAPEDETCLISQAPACSGSCQPGQVCGESTPGGVCICVPEDETCLISQAPACGGTCPPGQVCGQATGTDQCTCVSQDETCLISQVSACGGTCPAGEVCVQPTGTNVCDCFPEDSTCIISQAPACGGTCPEGQACSNTGSGCWCPPPGYAACGVSSAPQCDGVCPGDDICVGFDDLCSCWSFFPIPCGYPDFGFGAPHCWGTCPPETPICEDVSGTCMCTTGPCGNGALDPGEECDDGNVTNGDGCDNNCTPTACGNGIQTVGEDCDDGNTVGGDGCRAGCTVEVCGDTILDPNEACDDGNSAPGDGCGATCQVEKCFTCVGEPSVCTPDDDGALCDDGDTCTANDTCSGGTCDGTPIITCTDGDGCCPAGCDSSNDDDCQDEDTWSLTGEMETPRSGLTMTLLANGMVLVAGGRESGEPQITSASAELYAPSNGMWSPTGSMATKRAGHTATLLPNGMVLAAGGYDEQDTYPTSTAELYDPSTGMWNPTGRLNVARVGHGAILLPDGQVLVAGGWPREEGDGGLRDVEVYDPSAGMWRVVGSLNTGRSHDPGLTLLPDATVLIAGGLTCCPYTPMSSAELYDPLTETWTPTSSMNEARYAAEATLLPTGQVLIAGNGVRPPSPTAELYDPSTGTWTPTGRMATDRADPTVTLLPNGLVLIAGGRDLLLGGSSAELYDPCAGTWTSTGNLNVPRGYHAATLLPSGQVLVAGGESAGSSTSSAELYEPPAVELWCMP